jgi:hypothetical protein
LPNDNLTQINDERFFSRAKNKNPFDRDPEPLIVFPHEMPFTRKPGTRLSFSSYIENVWQQARRLVAEATSIWAIGYSFASIDRSDVLDLLRSAKNCKKLVVQDMPGLVDEICHRLQKMD